MKNKTEIYGNKYWEYREALEKMGVVHVSDGHVCLDRDLVLYGVDLAGTVLPAGNAVHGAGIYGKSPGKAR